MSCGRRDEALSVFRKIYSINTGNPPESYPVSVLLEYPNDDKFEYSSYCGLLSCYTM
jgi:hypothetical protein